MLMERATLPRGPSTQVLELVRVGSVARELLSPMAGRSGRGRRRAGRECASRRSEQSHPKENRPIPVARTNVGSRGGPRPQRRRFTAADQEEEANMLFTIAIVLCILWALGLVTSYTMGGFIHLLLAVALVVILIRVIQGRRVTG
jgi:hypothetical protein